MSVGHLRVYICIDHITEESQIKKMLKTVGLIYTILNLCKTRADPKALLVSSGYGGGRLSLWWSSILTSPKAGGRRRLSCSCEREPVGRWMVSKVFFACVGVVHGSLWWKHEQKCASSFTVVIREALCTVNLGNTYFPSVFNVQNEGKWLVLVEKYFDSSKLPQGQNTNSSANFECNCEVFAQN